MMAQTLLVATDGSPCAVAAEGLAVALATAHGWSILGLYAVDPRFMSGAFVTDLAGALGATFPGNFVGSVRQGLEARGEAALDRLRAACSDAHVPCETRMVHGIAGDAVCETAHEDCVVVLGRTGEASPWTRRLLGSTTEAASRRSPVPVLIVPGEARLPERVLVAFDGGPQAGMAITWAGRLARPPAPVTVLSIHADPAEAARTAGVGCALLEAEGVTARPVHGQRDPAEQILAEASAHDLVVMGSSRHSAFRDWVLGGTAARVMHESPVPILLCR